MATEDAEQKIDSHHTSEVQFQNTHAHRDTHIECEGGGRVSHSLQSKKKKKNNINLRQISRASTNVCTICTGSFILNALYTVIQSLQWQESKVGSSLWPVTFNFAVVFQLRENVFFSVAFEIFIEKNVTNKQVMSHIPTRPLTAVKKSCHGIQSLNCKWTKQTSSPSKPITIGRGMAEATHTHCNAIL